MREGPATGDPEETLAFLVALVPSFGAEWEAGEPASGNPNLHAIVGALAAFLGANHATLSTGQLRILGRWVNASVDAGGTRESAVSTCLLEHLHQLKLDRLLGPHLSREARKRTHA